MILFDIETDGLLDVLTKVHCICAINTDTNERITFGGTNGEYDSIEDGLELLENSDLVAHNLQGFDLPALQKLYPSFSTKGRLLDSLVMCRLIWPHQIDIDYIRKMGHLNGSHALAAWGERLGVKKGDFGKTTDWSVCTPEMIAYCQQDVEVLLALWAKIKSADFPDSAIQLEHEFAKRIEKQMQNGIDFDIEKAQILLQVITNEQEEIRKEAEKSFPAKETTITKVPKRNNAKKGHVSGVPYTEVKREAINIGSRQQVIEFFKDKYNWEPAKTTRTGNAALDSEVFEHLEFPEAALVAKYLDLGKCLGQLNNGKNALIPAVVAGKIYGRVNHNGARTGRATHFLPNVSQIQSPKKIYGKEFRELFIAPAGKVFVGADLKAIELRMLAHYLYAYDRGNYAETLLKSDIHTATQKAAGLPDRDSAKRFIFAFLYGAGQVKLGSIVRPTDSESVQRAVGKELKDNFLAKVDGLGDLIYDLKRTYNARKYVIGLDGRKLVPRDDYKTLNTLLQGGGAVVSKKWTCFIHQLAEDENIDINQHLHIHDEILLSCNEPEAEIVGEICRKAALMTGDFFNINLPIEAEAKIGRTWYEVH